MQQIATLLEHARRNVGPDRLSAVAQLKRLAIDPCTRGKAVSALVTLWRERLATPADLAPYADTVLEIWRDVFARVMPFQQATAKVEWIMDDDYAAVSRE